MPKIKVLPSSGTKANCNKILRFIMNEEEGRSESQNSNLILEVPKKIKFCNTAKWPSLFKTRTVKSLFELINTCKRRPLFYSTTLICLRFNGIHFRFDRIPVAYPDLKRGGNSCNLLHCLPPLSNRVASTCRSIFLPSICVSFPRQLDAFSTPSQQ